MPKFNSALKNFVKEMSANAKAEKLELLSITTTIKKLAGLTTMPNPNEAEAKNFILEQYKGIYQEYKQIYSQPNRDSQAKFQLNQLERYIESFSLAMDVSLTEFPIFVEDLKKEMRKIGTVLNSQRSSKRGATKKRSTNFESGRKRIA